MTTNDGEADDSDTKQKVNVRMHPETNTLATKNRKKTKVAVSELSLAISWWSKRRLSAQIVIRA